MTTDNSKEKQKDTEGAIFLRPQKAPDPKACQLEETKLQRGDHRREMAKYMLAMAEMLWESQAGIFSRPNSFVVDIRMGERIEFSTRDHAARVRSIEAACGHITRLWDTIKPRAWVQKKQV